MPKKKQDIENQNTKSKTEKDEPLTPSIKNTDQFLLVEIGEVHQSQTVPQEHRRRRFSENNLSELTDSIRQKGIIEPLVVRRNAGGFELVCGERRWLAAGRAGLKEIPVVLKELDENQVLEIQLDENLHREDVHPMDEAVWYQFIKEKYNATNSELALRVGKNEKYVAGRLKLNNLIDEAREDFELNRITFSHALEIAKFPPASQKDVLDLCFDTRWDNSGWVPDKDDLKPLHEVREEIESEILLSLKSAKFDTTATNLRDDNLPCHKCPERSGAKVKNLLFEDYEEFFKDSKDDRCLNPACFGSKTMRFVQITRAEKSAEIIAGGNRPNDYQIRLISWMPNNAEKIENFFDEKPLVDGEYLRVNFENKSHICESAEYGIFADNSGYLGDIIGVCADKKCKKHFSSNSNSSNSKNTKIASPAEEAAERKKRLDRKEKIFDSKVGEPVRIQVLTQAAKNFDAEKTIANHPTKSAEFSFMMLARMWQMQCRYSERTARTIADILAVKDFGKNLWRDQTEDIRKLPAEKQSQLFFLLLVAHIGEINEGYWTNQDEIIQLAETFGINYKLLDAQKRFELAPNKYKPVAKEYLVAVEARKNDTKVPRFYSPEYGLKIEAESKTDDTEDDLELEDDLEDFDEDEIDENDLGETTQG